MGYSATAETCRLRGKVAATTRHGIENTDLRRDLAAARIQDFARDVVAKAPALTAEQVDRISAVLRGGGRK